VELGRSHANSLIFSDASAEAELRLIERPIPSI